MSLNLNEQDKSRIARTQADQFLSFSGPPAALAEHLLEVRNQFSRISPEREKSPAELGVRLVDPHTDENGFTIGGVNTSDTLRQLKTLNGVPIAVLESEMRPGSELLTGSLNGFLGADESLLDVLVADNNVIHDLGITHQDVALQLRYMERIAPLRFGIPIDSPPFLYHDRVFHVRSDIEGFLFPQGSPFQDGTLAFRNLVITNLTNGTVLVASELHSEMISRYGFYEGKGTAFRLDPINVIDVFDFLI